LRHPKHTREWPGQQARCAVFFLTLYAGFYRDGYSADMVY